MKKRLLAILLALALVVSLMPVGVLAAPGGSTEDFEYVRGGGEATDEDNNVTVSKTAKRTGENAYEITLSVTVPGNVTVPGASADVVLVIDASTSMKGGNINSAKTAAKAFADELLAEGNTGVHMAVVTYTDEPSTVCELTDNAQSVKSAVDDIRISDDQGTNIQAGIYQARQLLAGSAAQNKVIVVLSDGDPTYSYQSVGTGEYTHTNYVIYTDRELHEDTVEITGFDYNTVLGSGSGYSLTYIDDFWDVFDPSYYGASKINATCTCSENHTHSFDFRYYENNGEPAIAEAGFAKDAGCEIYGLYLGDPSDEAIYTMSGIATDGGHYMQASNDSLSALLEDIAGDVIATTAGAVVDPMGDNIILGDVSGIDGVTETQNGLTWTPDEIQATENDGSTTYRITYPITVDGKSLENDGYIDANGTTTFTYCVDGEDKTIDFPIPRVWGEKEYDEPEATAGRPINVVFKLNGEEPQAGSSISAYIDVEPDGGSWNPYGDNGTVTFDYTYYNCKDMTISAKPGYVIEAIDADLVYGQSGCNGITPDHAVYTLDNVQGGSTVTVYVRTAYDIEFYLNETKLADYAETGIVTGTTTGLVTSYPKVDKPTGTSPCGIHGDGCEDDDKDGVCDVHAPAGENGMQDAKDFTYVASGLKSSIEMPALPEVENAEVNGWFLGSTTGEKHNVGTDYTPTADDDKADSAERADKTIKFYATSTEIVQHPAGYFVLVPGTMPDDPSDSYETDAYVPGSERIQDTSGRWVDVTTGFIGYITDAAAEAVLKAPSDDKGHHRLTIDENDYDAYLSVPKNYTSEIDAMLEDGCSIVWYQINNAGLSTEWPDISEETGEGYHVDGYIKGADITVRYHANNDTTGEGSYFDHPATSGQSYTVLNNGAQGGPSFSREGYTFKGWNTKDDGTGDWYLNVDDENTATEIELLLDNEDLYAQWTPNSGTEYTVEHYKQNLDGTYPEEPSEVENNLTGITGETATATPKSYEGFAYNAEAEGTVASGTITGDGSLVLKLYYDRNSYKVTYVWDNATAPTNTPNPPAEATVKYGQTVTVDTGTYDNVTENGKTYAFDHWAVTSPTGTTAENGSFTMPAADVTITGYWTSTDNLYTITIKYVNEAGETIHGDQIDKNWKHGATYSPLKTYWYDSMTGTDDKDYVFFGCETNPEGIEINDKTFTVTGDTTITLIYSLDENKDNIPDKYQATVTYKVENGTWEDGTDADKTVVFTLWEKGEDGVWQEKDPAPTLGDTIPTGMKPDDTHKGEGEWDVNITAETEVTGNATYTYTFNTAREFTVSIAPADIVAYTGGKAYGAIVGEDGKESDVTASGLPRPGYHIELSADVVNWFTEHGVASTDPDEAAQDLSQYITFTYDDGNGTIREWTLTYRGIHDIDEITGEPTRYVYTLNATGNAPDVRLQYKDGDEYVFTDDFDMDENTVKAEYEMSIYPGDLNQNLIKAVIKVGEESIEATTKVGTGKLTVLSTTNVEYTNPITNPADGKISAAVPAGEDVTFTVNDSQVELDDDQVSLLVDSVSDSAEFNAQLEELAANAAGMEGAATESFYLDLVHAENGNVQVGLNGTLTINWPMPSDANPEGDFKIVHYIAMDRNDTFAVDDLTGDDYHTNEVIENDDGTLSFDVKSFSPFVLVYEAKETAVTVDKSASDHRPEVGDRVKYTLVVENTGNTTLNNVVVADTLWESGMKIMLDTTPVTLDSDSLTISTIILNQVITITYYYTPTWRDVGRLVNEATVTAGEVTDSDTVTVIVDDGWTPNIPDDDDEDVEPEVEYTPNWLNTDDHFAYIVGYEDGSVRPTANITRAEVATIFFRLLTDEARAEFWSSENDFTDVASDAWYNNAVSTLSGMGILGGYEDGSFRPNASITRAEFVAIATRFFEYSARYEGGFTDVSYGDWYADCVQASADMGLVNGYEDGSFRPNASITRAEACAIVNRVLHRIPHEDHLLSESVMNVWPDNPKSAWYYADMQEATNSHDYDWTRESGSVVEDWTDKLPERDWSALETEWANAYSK